MQRKTLRRIVLTSPLFTGALIGVLLAGCTTTPTPTEPEDRPIHILPVPNPPAPSPVPVVPADPLAIDKIVAGSSCSTYSWTKRGRAPVGYIKGMAKTYARSLCRYLSPNKTPAGVMGQLPGDAGKDALAHYGLNAAKGTERLKDNYTMLIGLGMRESSGNYGEGRDLSANWTSSDTAETGLFQFSYNLNSASPMLQALYDEYKAHPENCMEVTFKEGVKKAVNENYSSIASESPAKREAGLAFQKFARHCPAFAAEYTAVGIRTRRAHWGPINRKEVEVKQVCKDMLTKVEAQLRCQ